MGLDLYLGGMNVFILFDKVIGHDRGKKFRRCYRMLLCHDVNGVLHGVGSHNDAVVRLGIAAVH